MSIILLVFLSGCLNSPVGEGQSPEAPAEGEPRQSPTDSAVSPTQTATASAEPTQPPKLESVLFDLHQAENPAVFAKQHDLEVRDGRVLVVVELKAEGGIPKTVTFNRTAQHSTEVQGYTPIEELVALSTGDGVRFVRTPREAQTPSQP